jgi:ATP-binding cassette subfamily B protein
LVDHERPANGPPPQTLGAFFKWCLAGYFGVIGFGAVASAGAGLVEVLMAFQLGVIVDAAVSAGGITASFWGDHAWMIIAWLGVLFLLRPAMFFTSGAYQSVAVAPNVFKLVLARLHRYTLGQAVTFFDNDFAGRISQKQMQTTRALVDVVTETMNAVSLAVASVLATAAIIGAISPLMAVIVAAWLVLYVLFLRFMIPQLRVLSAKRAATRAMVTGQVVDTITNIKTVKLFASTSHEDRAAIGAIDNFREAGLDWAQMAVFFRLGLVLIAGILPAAVVSLGLYLVAQGSATPGELTAMGAMAIRLAHMTGWVSWTLLGIYGNVGEVEDGMRTLAPPQELTDAADAVVATGKAEIQFDDVTFAYGREAGGVHGIDLTIHEGEKLGIVGASGAGKSTLVSLLLRLYDTEEGAVRVGGQDVREVTQESLRQRIGMVTQETAMFNRSARENILYGSPDASEDQMIDAARRARAHDFITGLKDFKDRQGYDAYLGERGVKLSGGQRQRIALARAILKDAPILVLDEATSALDSEVEAEIQAALEEVMEGKTVLAIAHRLSTIARMDRIIVLDQGRIVEEGTHSELLSKNGTYARFWNRQSGGFIGLAEAAE